MNLDGRDRMNLSHQQRFQLLAIATRIVDELAG
jgi:hypothetical protein